MRFTLGLPILIVVVGRLLLPWLPFDWLLANTLLDDAFYYFETARNIAASHGVTFDGEHPTNGFHPLWMLLNVLVYSVIGEGGVLPIRILLILATAFDLAAAFLLFKIVSSFTQRTVIRWGALFLYLLNPYLIQASLNGMETSLTIFLLALLIFLLLRVASPAWIGLTGGLLTLARLDYGIFFLAALAYLWWRERKLSPVLISAIVGGVLLLPWVIWSTLNFGTPIPISGLAYSFTTHELFYYKPRPLWQIIAWSGLWGWKTLVVAFKQTGAGLLFAAGAIATISYLIYAWRRRTFVIQEALRRPFALLAIFLVAFAAFSFIHGPIRWTPRPWYFLSFPMLILLGAAFLIEHSQRVLQKRSVFWTVGILVAVSYAWSAASLQDNLGNQREMFAAAEFINEDLPSDARIASFNAGIVGYFSNRFVMNADGLINASAYEAMRQRQLWQYFKENRITHIADYEVTLTYRHKPVLGIEDALARLEPLATIDFPNVSYAGSVLRIYKVKTL